MGGNLGPVRQAFEVAVRRLAERFGDLRVAPLYRSEPVSEIRQPDFMNTVAVGITREPAGELHAFARQLESALGRRRRRRNGPREIDLDLLFVGDEVYTDPQLVLPHPRLRSRRFVLAPLADLLPDHPLPPDGATPRQLLARLPSKPWVERWTGD